MTAPKHDIVIVGGGGSGLAAAASAAQNGARVIVLEKEAELGGCTAIAVGSFTAAETSYQKKAGITDRVEDHAQDAGKFATPGIEARNNAELRRYFIERSSETLDWLAGLGLVFQGPSPEPPNRVPRMHNVVPGARAYILALEQVIRRHGGEILPGARANGLILEKRRVIGVQAEVDGIPAEFMVSKGVILAAGDYSSSPDLIAENKGKEFAGIEGICASATGDGHRLCEAVGAVMINMDVTYGPELRFIPPERKSLLRRLPAGGVFRNVMGAAVPFVPKGVMNAVIKRELVTWQHPEDRIFRDGAILVNARGERFCNETVSPAREIAIAAQPGKIAYILLDERLIALYDQWPNFISTAPEIAYAYVKDYLRLRPDVALAMNSLSEIAALRCIPPGRLEHVVSVYNRYATGKAADQFSRTGDSAPLQGSRWVMLGPVKACFTTTEGAPAINRNMQVLDGDGVPIPGLYAVGQNGLGGQILWGHGLHIAWAMTSGRLAGRLLAGMKAP
ncbi:MAG TPA: FAD-dependent oxidoreductase [Candidatus Brocadiia bacterium]|nr:FAD-dependent oxidoreductase [Candidatus Brocadiia bacterium]